MESGSVGPGHDQRLNGHGSVPVDISKFGSNPGTRASNGVVNDDTQIDPQRVGVALEDTGDEIVDISGPEDIKAAAQSVEDRIVDIEAARRVSVVSLVASIVVAVLGLGIGISENVLSLIGFGLECLLDGISSALVLWRFKVPKKRQHADVSAAERHCMERDARRERNSSVGIGVSFLCSAGLLILFAVIKLIVFNPNTAEHLEEERSGAYYSGWLSWPSCIIFGGLAIAKFRLSRSLQSQVLLKDALCSLLGAILAFICAVASIIEQVGSNWDQPANMEMVDIGASVLIALILAVEGARTLRHNLPKTGAWATDHQPMA
mmetsp:Transcript_105896/g.210496  ORF Transcript_105896/g.210496 Transcript_105896/m.210496 type:complete len:320 (-) Transcript_105896:93-1052(-)